MRAVSALLLGFLCFGQLQCLTITGWFVTCGFCPDGGGPTKVGGSVGFLGDMAVAAKIAGTAGTAYGVLAIPFLIVSFLNGSGGSGEMEIPIFSPNKKKLWSVVKTGRHVLLITEPPIQGSELDRSIPAFSKETFERMDRESYYALIDYSRRKDIQQKQITLEGVVRAGKGLSKTVAADLILYVRAGTPVTSCGLKGAEYWTKALDLSGGQSEGALGNLGYYQMLSGEFEKAAEYFERAKSAKGSDKNYWREMKKRAEEFQRKSTVPDRN